VRWGVAAADGLAALAAAGDPLGCFASERERLLLGDRLKTRFWTSEGGSGAGF
jgi:hypothetical protein